MTEKNVPTPNTHWVLFLHSKDKIEEVFDWLETLGCEVKRDIDPVPLDSGKVAIGTFGPPNLDVFIEDDEKMNPIVDSANPQLTSSSLWG